MESKIVYDIFHLIYWDWRIAMDLFLGGLGVGAFLYAISIMFYTKKDNLVSVKIGAVLGPAAMAAGLLFMLSEMGQPFRIYKTWLRFNLTSTLSWGGMLQQGFIFFSSLFAVLLLVNKGQKLKQSLAVFAGFFALFVACYHGFLLSFVTARPLWNAGAVNIASVLSSLNAGAASIILFTSFTARGRAELKEMSALLKNSLLILILAQISACLIWLVTLITGKADFVHAYHVLNERFGLVFWLGAIVLGLIIPFLTLSLYNTGAAKKSAAPLFLASIPIIIGSFIFRYILILAGQMS